MADREKVHIPTHEIPWTHDPTDRQLADHYRALTTWVDGQKHTVLPGGWTTVMGLGHAERCDLKHPNVESDVGSCGGTPGHEHPHIWTTYGSVLKSVSRTVFIHA